MMMEHGKYVRLDAWFIWHWLFTCMKIRFINILTVCFLVLLFSMAVVAEPVAEYPRIELKPVFPKLQLPRMLWMCEAPDDSQRMFMVGQGGRILVAKKGSDGADAKEFLNIEDRHPYFEDEDGLLSMAFHPGFKTNGLFYIYYTQTNDPAKTSSPLNFPYRSVISEMKVLAGDPDKADVKSERILLEIPQPYWNHKGGEIVFGPDGYLYIALGDGGWGSDPMGNGQNTATLLAKILRIDVNHKSMTGEGVQVHEIPYAIPTDNPFAHEPQKEGAGVRREIFAYGLRNAWRYSFDRVDGFLWAGDAGQELWEEIDIIVKGGNYGWCVREGSHFFKPGPDSAKYEEPIIEYPHTESQKANCKIPDHEIGLCVVGGYVYHGKKYPRLDGVYIYGDYALGSIWGARYDSVKKRLISHGTLLSQPRNICSFAEDRDGELYVILLDNGVYAVTTP